LHTRRGKEKPLGGKKKALAACQEGTVGGIKTVFGKKRNIATPGTREKSRLFSCRRGGFMGKNSFKTHGQEEERGGKRLCRNVKNKGKAYPSKTTLYCRGRSSRNICVSITWGGGGIA